MTFYFNLPPFQRGQSSVWDSIQPVLVESALRIESFQRLVQELEVKDQFFPVLLDTKDINDFHLICLPVR